MKDRKKICFLCDNILSIGGVQRVLSVIGIALTRHYDVDIITLHDDKHSDTTLYGLDQSKVNIVRFVPHPTSFLSAFFHRIVSALYRKVMPHNKLTSQCYAHSSFPRSMRKQYVRILNEGNYDIIIGVHAGLSIKLATLRRELRAWKVMGWMHNSYEALFLKEHSYLTGLDNHFKHQICKLDDFIVLCHTDAQMYKVRMQLSPTVIYNPLTLTPAEPSSNTSKQFLSIGRMSPLHKGFDILIEAFSIFARENNEWTLSIVGEGSEEPLLRSLIAKNKLEERVHIHPFTNNIQEYYHNASVYILSSRWEGMPLVLAEAMSHRLPIICSDIPVAKELLNSDTALFFENENIYDLASKMHQMANMDASSLGEMGSQALAYSSKLSIDSIAQEWIECIESNVK